MFRNYFKIALRHLWQNRLYSGINVVGLALGLTCVLLAVLYIQDEHQFDTFHRHNPHLYRITTTAIETKGESPQVSGGTGQVQGPAFKAAVPEVSEYVRVMGGSIFGDVRSGQNVMKMQLLFADSNFFDVFSFKLIHGNPKTVLKEVGSVVIPEKTALKFFNTTDVVGKTLHLEADPSAQRLGKPLVISGVVENPPSNSSIQFDVLHPFSFMQLSFEDTYWLNAYLGTFVVLTPTADKAAVIRKFNQIHARNAQKQIKDNGFDPQVHYGLQPITDMHLYPLHTGGEGGAVNYSNPMYSYLFLGIALFILMMASINFVNITIASSLKRAKEVGIRKVTGSRQRQIIFQFLGESSILCFVSLLLATILTILVLPAFNELANKQFTLSQLINLEFIAAVVGVLVLNILLSGLYPAYVLSKFNPTEVLYRKQKLLGKSYLGQGLVLFQFSLAVVLIIASFVFFQQMDFIRTKDLGYNPYQVIRSYISGNRETKPIAEFLKNELAKEPSVVQTSFGGDWGNNHTVVINHQTIRGFYQIADNNFFSVMGIRLQKGRLFTASSAAEVIVNEAFVKATGLKNPLGEMVTLESHFGRSPSQIVGVVKDFHFNSLRNRIMPLVMTPSNVHYGGIWIKVNKHRQQEAVRAFERIYRRALPNAVFEYDFLDELNNQEYLQEQRWQWIIGIATLLSLILCGMGLFGVMHLAIHQRTKEIGVRKVLGASVRSIVLLLTKNVVRPVVLSSIIASPIAYYLLQQWLANFAYRIELSGTVFIGAGGLALLIALLTVSSQALKAAWADPVHSIKQE